MPIGERWPYASSRPHLIAGDQATGRRVGDRTVDRRRSHKAVEPLVADSDGGNTKACADSCSKREAMAGLEAGTGLLLRGQMIA